MSCVPLEALRGGLEAALSGLRGGGPSGKEGGGERGGALHALRGTLVSQAERPGGAATEAGRSQNSSSSRRRKKRPPSTPEASGRPWVGAEGREGLSGATLWLWRTSRSLSLSFSLSPPPGGAFEAASREASALSLAFSRPPAPPPQDQEQLADRALGAVLAAASIYYRLPKSQGTTLRKAVRDATVELAEGMIQLTEILLRKPVQSVSREQLISTGSVWEACDRASALPRDNQAAVALAISSCLGIVKDALEEMEQAQQEGADPYGDVLEDEELGSRGNRDVYWSEADRRLLGPCLGLVKAAKACLKKVLGAVRAHGQADAAERVAQLDDLADMAADVSPSVDELALSTYPPVNQLSVRLNAAKLASVLKKMLEIARSSHVCPPSEEGWVKFLLGAVDHNLDRIKSLTQSLV
uniref:Cyclin-D1-binding protein 1 n=1 Tax=Anolis carolinensis TaxID=28377 RepID=A0A803TGW0_ANOCA